MSDTVNPTGYEERPEPQQPAGRCQRWPAVIIALIPTSVSLGLYLATLTSEVDWGDSAELSLQAYQLGVTHPPGYPIHTFLGKLFIIFFRDPGRATNLLSAVFTALATGILALVAYQLCRNWFAAVPAALVFALSPQVWRVAVITEVYGVNVFFVALAMWLLLRWYQRPSAVRLLITGTAFGISLGSSLANLLLLPAFALLVSHRTAFPQGAAVSSPTGRRCSHAAIRHADQISHHNAARDSVAATALFLLVGSVVGGLVLSWSYLRSHVIPPLGTTSTPDSPLGFLAFITGAQYTRAGVHSLDFYAYRAVEHARVFGQSFLWAGLVPGLAGAWSLWRRERMVGLALSIAFATNMAYFTSYAATDYHLMVTTSYLIFSLWLACGVRAFIEWVPRLPAWPIVLLGVILAICGVVLLVTAVAADWFALGKFGFGKAQQLMLVSGSGLAAAALVLRAHPVVQWLRSNLLRLSVVLIVLALAAVLGYTQWHSRRTQARSGDVTVFVLSSFEVLPENAVVVAQWDKLPPMLFYQKTRGLRPDLTIVEPISDWRHYLQSTSRPVLIDKVDRTLAADYHLEPIPHGWYLILPKVASDQER